LVDEAGSLKLEQGGIEEDCEVCVSEVSRVSSCETKLRERACERSR